ncbi:hypothetical protein LT493_36085 [Streptomyces tricolor]|nr:hypothetical protein [Streptomyces tricolor]
MHGRGALFDVDPAGLAPRLVGLRPHRHRADPYEHPDEPLFVVRTGGRGLARARSSPSCGTRTGGHTPVAGAGRIAFPRLMSGFGLEQHWPAEAPAGRPMDGPEGGGPDDDSGEA